MGKQSTQPSPSYHTPAVPMEGGSFWTILQFEILTMIDDAFAEPFL